MAVSLSVVLQAYLGMDEMVFEKIHGQREALSNALTLDLYPSRATEEDEIDLWPKKLNMTYVPDVNGIPVPRPGMSLPVFCVARGFVRNPCLSEDQWIDLVMSLKWSEASIADKTLRTKLTHRHAREHQLSVKYLPDKIAKFFGYAVSEFEKNVPDPKQAMADFKN
ncbi:MAG: hypothetical protein Q9221_007382 [Calogaya cf. arnoldii]